ncbi:MULTISPECIES: inositol monophosphatase [unclassified Corynebacterium]|uniref:inositol monophosphatase family protein n=1 Tax=unclassified Corynebacterium TaxID=2624378 RepID=UPI003525E922
MDARGLLAVAEAVADDAERSIRSSLGIARIMEKGEGDVATEVDLAVEATVRRQLTLLTGIPVFGEEAGGDPDCGAVWVVDPVDGTSNFAVGNPMCAFLLSLLVDGQPVCALTSQPATGQRFTAYSGSPLMVNGKPQRPISERDPWLSHIGFGSIISPVQSSYPTSARHELLDRLGAKHPRLRVTGSVGLDLAFTAAGIFGGAVTFSPHVWDNAAGVLLVRAAGGVVTDLFGAEWQPDSFGVVAGAKSVHDVILGTISETLGSDR